MIYLFGWTLLLIFFKLYLGFKTYGRENVPKTGPFILVSNHQSYLDPILLGTSIHRNLYYLARSTLFKHPVCAVIMKGMHCISLKRDSGNVAALKVAIRTLKSGRPIVLFPEGTRTKGKGLKRGKPGVGFIVAKAGVPVVPAYVKGSFEAMPRQAKTLRRRPVSVHIGKPVTFSEDFFRTHGKEAYQKVSDVLMQKIREIALASGATNV